jgi:transcription elongation GreA/GreB family factor
VYEAAGEDAILAESPRDYAVALFKADDFPRTQRVIERLAAAGPLPRWALELATEIALRRGDAIRAIEHLQSLVALGQPRPPVLLELASRLIDVGRAPEAAPHVSALLDLPDLAPIQKMRLAQLLLGVDRPDDAVRLAYRAFREGSNEAQVHRAFITIVMQSKVPPLAVSEVGADTHVALTDNGGNRREHTIYQDPPIDPLRNDMDLEKATAAGLLGKTVGDTVVESPGTFKEHKWTVEAIMSALHYNVQDAMMNYEVRFPNEPFFIARFTMSDPPSLGSFSPIIASLQARRQRTLESFSVYRQNTLPLGLLATLLGSSIPELMIALSTAQDPPVLFVEWFDRPSQELTSSHKSVLDTAEEIC